MAKTRSEKRIRAAIREDEAERCDVREYFRGFFVICIPVNPSPVCKSSLDGRGLKRHFTEGATTLPFVRGDRVKT